MRALLIFATLMAAALARPEPHHGGNTYLTPAVGSGGGYSSEADSRNQLNRDGSLYQKGISSYEAPFISGNGYSESHNSGSHGSGSHSNGGGHGGHDQGRSFSGNSGFGGSSNGGFGGSSGGGSFNGNSGFGGSSSGGFGGSSGGGSAGGQGRSFNGNSGFGGSSSGGFGGSSGGGSAGGQGRSFNGNSGSQGSELTIGVSQVIDISRPSGNGRSSNSRGSQGTGPIITKQIYIHESPEEKEIEEKRQRQIDAISKKNYNILFIKTPSSGESAGSSNPNVYAQTEEKTIVYVLSKKNDGLGEDGEFPSPPPAITSKPEVFFVKYNTKDEADSAVSSIQESFQEGGQGYNSPAAFAKSIGASSSGSSSGSFGSSSGGSSNGFSGRSSGGSSSSSSSGSFGSSSGGSSGSSSGGFSGGSTNSFSPRSSSGDQSYDDQSDDSNSYDSHSHDDQSHGDHSHD